MYTKIVKLYSLEIHNKISITLFRHEFCLINSQNKHTVKYNNYILIGIIVFVESQYFKLYFINISLTCFDFYI